MKEPFSCWEEYPEAMKDFEREQLLERTMASEPHPHLEPQRDPIEEDVWKVKCIIDELRAKNAHEALEEIAEHLVLAQISFKREAA